MDLENDVLGSHADETQLSDRTRLATSGKSVLILDFDLFRDIGGGGQSCYRRLIELHPENCYYYFLREEGADVARPSNAQGIPFIHEYYANTGDLPGELTHFYSDYLHCWTMAASARAKLGKFHFDVIDTPDYYTSGLFARDAFQKHAISVDVVALALHGTISSALRDQWPRASVGSRSLAELRTREHLQYRTVDVRYALSQAYADDWKAYSGIPARSLDPISIVGKVDPRRSSSGGPPDLIFVGRKERRKGPDLFLDLAWCLDPSTYGSLRFIGSDATGTNGVSSAPVLEAISRRRKVFFASQASIPKSELNQIFEGRSILLLPSRYDQFNLVALEALRLGCPTFLSRRAGAERWIRAYFPALQHLLIDIDCSRTAADAVRAALADYDGFRNHIVDVLSAGAVTNEALNASSIYEPIAPSDANANLTVSSIRVRFDSFNRPRENRNRGPLSRTKQYVKKSIIKPLSSLIPTKRKVSVLKQAKRLRGLRKEAKSVVRRFAMRSLKLHEGADRLILAARQVEGTRKRLLRMPERTQKEITQKLTRISSELGFMRVARAQIFREMARLERKRHGDLIAAAYCLRAMRWLNQDAFGDLEFVTHTLSKHKFEAEAEVAFALFADNEKAEGRSRTLLDDQFRRHLKKSDLPLEIFDDRRGSTTPKVAVIASLYSAEAKLKTLLCNLGIQSLARKGGLEVILVDSGSPTHEYKVFEAFAAENALPIVYARSKERETIQGAWNRGIKLARAPYLSFLGVDEGLHPDALSILARSLDDNPNVDWVMADSIVTDVDKDGIYAGDIMAYDRSGYDQNLVYLETCYLSWVGGLYRKSIHDRFGYYDETFRAAGDTEFKGRVLTHIKTMHIQKPLGVFNNYPEERTTQHPRAEIEDLRAWYLHRSIAGIAYSFDAHDASRAEDLFRRALSYRKSFCGHISTDFDLAVTVGEYLQRRGESGKFGVEAAASSRTLVEFLRQLDQIDLRLSPRLRQFQTTRALMSASRQEADDQVRFDLPTRPTYRLVNDNRYEQHWWSWST